MSDLPPGWSDATIGDLLLRIEAGKSFRCEPRPASLSEWGIIKVSAMTWGAFRDGENKAVPVGVDFNPDHEIRTGDILVSRANTQEYVGAPVLVERCRPRLLLSDKSLRLVPSPHLNRRWVYHLLSSPTIRREISHHATGTKDSMRNISQEALTSIPVQIPPLAEQDRIVAAIEENLSRLSAASFAADTASRRIKKFTASVLEAAATGRLSRTLKTDSDVTELIEQSRDLMARSRSRNTSGRRERELPPDAVMTIAPCDLPSTWRWVPWCQLGRSRNGGAFPSSYYQDQGIKLIRPGNMHQSGRVVWSPNNTRFLPEKFASIKPDLVIKGRALIMNLTAQSLKDEFLGRACITENSEAALLNQRLAWLIPARIDLDYISVVFRSPIFRHFVARLNTGSLIQHMFTWQVDQFQVPVPPPEEQHRIVACVSELLDGADRMTRATVHSQRKAQALRIQLLSDTLSGKLVPQDPMDEPASALVARMRAELAARPRPRRGHGMTKLVPQRETLL